MENGVSTNTESHGKKWGLELQASPGSDAYGIIFEFNISDSVTFCL